MSTSMLLTGAGSSRSSGGGPVDPLAGIPYLLRFETHWGDKSLLPYFFQDVARTIPATTEGDVIATMGPASATFVPDQADNALQSALLLAGDGTPYLDFDGVDDHYPIGAAGGTAFYTVLLRSKVAAWNSYWSPVDQQLGTPPQRWGLFQGGQMNYHNDPPPVEVRLNGVELASPLDSLAPITDWMVITTQTNNSGASNPRALFQLENFQFGNAELIAFFIYDGAPSDIHRDTVEAFYATLKPAP